MANPINSSLDSFLIMQALVCDLPDNVGFEFRRRLWNFRYEIRSDEDNQRREFSLRELRYALERFGLLAFVLHSPERHWDLHNKLQEDFEILDQTTGTNFLFFATVAPSKDWLHSTESRPYRSQILRHNLLEPKGLTVVNPDASLCALARAFGVVDLPAIVVLNPRRPNDRVLLQTSALEIEQQLVRLGSCAAQQDVGEPLSDRMQRWRLGNTLQLTPGGLALYRAALALAGPASQGDFAEHAKNLLTSQLETDLPHRRSPRWESEIRRYTDDWDYRDGPGDFVIGRLLDKAFYLGALSAANALPCNLGNPDDGFRFNLLANLERNRLEIETSGTLASAEAILSSGAPLDDYSPIIICIAKAFECEINASLVQWFRQQKGVEMPAFFKRHAPGINAVVGDPNRPVDLNAQRGAGAWHPPSLGQSLWIFNRCFQNQPEELSSEAAANLFEIWETILPLRNRAAHVEIMEQTDFNRAVEVWNHLRISSLLDLLRLKQRLGKRPE